MPHDDMTKIVLLREGGAQHSKMRAMCPLDYQEGEEFTPARFPDTFSTKQNKGGHIFTSCDKVWFKKQTRTLFRQCKIGATMYGLKSTFEF
jgi:hypothetical protein